MKNLPAFLLGGMLLLDCISGARAGPITLEPDDYAAGTNISTKISEVRLSAVTPDSLAFISDVFTVTPTANPPINVPTGSRVFGGVAGLPPAPFLFRNVAAPFDANNRWLLIEFDDPVNTVSVDFGRQSPAMRAMSFSFV